MIEIRYIPNKSVTISGHAGYAEKGKDIVCSAISALYCTMIMADGIAGNMDENGNMIARVMHVKAEDTFRVFCAGMKKVAEQYPTFVQFRRDKQPL